MDTATVSIDLDGEFREMLERAIIERVELAVEAARERNDILQEYADQVDGILDATSPQPWQNASLLEDRITFEHCITQTASMMAALRAEPYWTVEGKMPGDETSAASLEGAMQAKAPEWKIRERVYDACWNANRFPYSPMYVGWKREFKKRRYTGYEDPDGMVVEEDAKREGVEYKEVPAQRMEIEYNGADIRTVEPSDLYLYPPDAKDIGKALSVIERMYLTREELLNGTVTYGYEKEAVAELIRLGPDWEASGDSVRGNNNDSDGVEAIPRDGYYECFQVIGRVPIILKDEEIATPEWLLDEDWVWMVCPARKKIFKMAPMPYAHRPYVVFYTIRNPNRFMGQCIPQILHAIQREATSNIRFKVNVMNLICSPVLKIPEKTSKKRTGYKAYPGAKWLYDTSPDEIDVVQWDFQTLAGIAEMQADLRTRAQQLISAEGVNSNMGGKVRKAAEVAFTDQQISQKDDLYLQTFLEGMEQLGILLVSLYEQHMPPEGEEMVVNQAPVKVTPDDLKKHFRLIPHANSDANNPAIRLQTAQAKQQTQLQYFQALATLPPDKWSEAYFGARRVLEALNERNIEGWLGKEPTGVDPMLVLSIVMPLLMQAAQIDPIAAQIMAVLDEQMAAMEQSNTQGAGMSAPMGAQGGMQPSGNPAGGSPRPTMQTGAEMLVGAKT